MKWFGKYGRKVGAAPAAAMHVYPRPAAPTATATDSSSSSNSDEIPPKTRKKTKSGNFQMYHFIWLLGYLVEIHNISENTVGSRGK